MTNPISGLGASSAIPAASEGQATAPREWGFVETLRGAIDEAEQLQGSADAKVTGLLQGNGMDVHSAMIAVERADLSFQLMMQVRNKIVSAYQEISRMQF
jgi:flagellar hook-basal body complex protein FliE